MLGRKREGSFGPKRVKIYQFMTSVPNIAPLLEMLFLGKFTANRI